MGQGPRDGGGWRGPPAGGLSMLDPGLLSTGLLTAVSLGLSSGGRAQGPLSLSSPLSWDQQDPPQGTEGSAAGGLASGLSPIRVIVGGQCGACLQASVGRVCFRKTALDGMPFCSGRLAGAEVTSARLVPVGRAGRSTQDSQKSRPFQTPSMLTGCRCEQRRSGVGSWGSPDTGRPSSSQRD